MTIVPEKASARAKRIGGAIAGYRQIHLKYAPQQELVEEMDTLRHVGLETRGEPQELLVVLEGTFSGKTSAARLFKRNVEKEVRAGSDDVPVVLATAAAGCTSRALAAALLRGVGVRFAPGMTEEAMWQLWPQACRRRGVQIAIVDEIQHAHDGKFTRGVTNTLKNQLAVNVPLIVLGTRAADELLTSNQEVGSRTFDTVSLRPMTWGETADEAIWTDFLGRLDAAMEDAAIVGGSANLASYGEPLCAAALGRVGLVKKIVQTALRLALRRGADVIVEADLARATDVWSIRHRYLRTNPFRSREGGT